MSWPPRSTAGNGDEGTRRRFTLTIGLGWRQARHRPLSIASVWLASPSNPGTALNAPRCDPRWSQSLADSPSMLGCLVRQARLRAGLSQSDLGVRLGRSQSIISRWERGVAEPSCIDVPALAAAVCLTAAAITRAADPHKVRRYRRRRVADEASAWQGRELARRRALVGPPLGVARAAGLTARRLARIEQGAEPSIGELQAIARAIGSEYDDLLARSLTSRRSRRHLAGTRQPASHFRSDLRR